MKFDITDYKIEVSKVAKEEGGGYIAYLPELDCYGDGDSLEEAIHDAYSVAEDLINLAIEDGKSIPKPQLFIGSDEFSGKLSLRVPKTLHKMLNQKSKQEGCSINQLIISYISFGLGESFGKISSTMNITKKFEDITMMLAREAIMWKQPTISVSLGNKYQKIGVVPYDSKV